MVVRQEEAIEIHPILQRLRTNPVTTPEYGWFSNSGGLKLFYRVFEPKSGVVDKVFVGCHGASGDGEYFILLADQIVEQTKVALYFMDYRGHGRSEGKRGDIKDFQFYIDDLKEFIVYLRQKYPRKPFFLVGVSMGGIVSLNYVAQNPDSVHGLIEFAPGVRFHLRSFSVKDAFKVIGYFFSYITGPGRCVIKVKGREDFGVRDEIHQRYDFENPYHFEKVSPRYLLQLNKFSKKAYYAGGKITCPIIIFQGEADRAVSPEGVKAYFETIQSNDKELHMIPEAFHVLFTDPAFPKYWDILRVWIKSH
ncbi:MAG: alpha/beta fold hydrolase [Candidatus Helarchaeota archaeon]